MMESETEEKVEPEKPNVGLVLKAEESYNQSTNGDDPELSTDTPVETGLCRTFKNELVMSPQTKMHDKSWDSQNKGKKPEDILKTSQVGQNSRPSTSDRTTKRLVSVQNAVSSTPPEVLDESIVESEISELSLIQLKKYYKWRILGVDFSEALVKAKESGQMPPTTYAHPDCKLSWEEINQISLLIPARHVRSKFQIETYFGGKDPEEYLKRALSSSKKRHPDCRQTWEHLMKMADKLPKMPLKLKFVVATFYDGEKPEKLLKTMLSAIDLNSKPSAVIAPAKDSCEKIVFSSTRDKISGGSVPQSDPSKLSFDRLLEYHKWLIQGSSSGQALMKAKELGETPQSEEPRSSSNLPRDSSCESTFYNDPTTIEGGLVIRNMTNGKLKYYYLCRNDGLDEEEALSKAHDLEDYSGEHLPHPKCKQSFEKLKRMSTLFVDRSSRDRFFIHTYYGGKDPERTMEYLTWRCGKPDNPEDVWYAFDEHLGAVEKIGMGNGKLKYYYLWLNKGYNHKEALSKIAEEERIGGTHRAHPDCKYSREDLMKIAQALKSDTHTMARFVIHTYFGGKDPESTLKYLISQTTKTDEPEDILAVESFAEDKVYEPVELIKKSNGKLKFYYLWRNEGFDHKKALAKVAQLEKFPGHHAKHPNCKHSRHQLMKLSQEIKNDVNLQERFLVITCFGGFDPEATLKWLKSGSRLEDESEAEEDESPSTRNDLPDSYKNPNTVEDGPIRNLANKKLKYYYLWRNAGYDMQRALTKTANSVIPHQQSPHPQCKQSPEELKKMAQALSSDANARDRFLIHTYFGGKDPGRTLRYFMSRSGKAGKKAYTAERSSTRKGSVEGAAFSSDAAREKFLIDTYFGGKSRSERELEPARASTESSSSGSESDGEGESSENHQSKKLEDYLKEGLPYELALSKVKGRAKKSADLMKPRYALPLPFERTKSHSQEPGIIPLDSPYHPYNQLTFRQLKNYYLWISEGYSHEEAMVKAKTPGLFPSLSRSNNLVPLKQLKSMSKRLPNERLVKIFIVETYYAGADPEEMMDFLLSKGHCINASPQKISSVMAKEGRRQESTGRKERLRATLHLSSNLIQVPIGEQEANTVPSPMAPTSELRDGPKQSASFGSEDSSNNPFIIEEQHIRHLSNGLLRCYYLWRNKSGPELALINLKKRENFPGTQLPHPDCKHSKPQLEEMAQALLPDISECDRFFIHTYYGGKDPKCALRYFLTSKESSNPSGLNPTLYQQQQNHPPVADPPSVAYQHPTNSVPTVTPPYQQPCPSLGHAAMPTYHDARSPFAAYPDYCPPVANQTVVYPSNQFQTAGMVGSMACFPPYGPADASLPTMAYPEYPQDPLAYPHQPHTPMAYPYQPQAPTTYPEQPQAPMAYTGYPHALGPSTVTFEPSQCQSAPPTQQQPPPSLNGGSSSNTPSILSKPGEPVVGEDVQIQSSLKRRTDDSTPEEPSHPKKIRKEEKLGKVDSPAAMYIVLAGYPKEYLAQSQMDAIECSMLEAILEMDDDGTKPVFKDPSRSNGRYGITCIDQFSVNWLHKFLDTYRRLAGASLKLISSHDTNVRIRANAVLPPCKEDDDEKILRYLARQNKDLNVSNWTVMERWDGDFNTRMDLVIDEESAKVLQKCSRVGFKLGLAEVVTAKNDSPRSSRVGDRNRSRLAGSPKRPYASRPPTQPPPSKKSSINNKSLAPSRKSVRRMGVGSPQRASPAQSPSRVRFGRWMSTSRSRSPSQGSGSRTPSPNEPYGEKPSWLAGLFSEKNECSASLSFSQVRSSSPELYRKTKRPRRFRRRSRSSSSSS